VEQLIINIKMKIEGNIVNIHTRDTYPAIVTVEGGVITDIARCNRNYKRFIIPGFIDAHVHIESSMVTPGAFASAAVRHGTIGTISDPHEIANVMGLKGVEYMIEDGNRVPFYFWFGAPSCVPATSFESSGATIGVDEIDLLMAREEVKYLSEMMNFPGVLNNDKEVYAKIESARKHGKPIDGHAPGLKGENLIKYVNSGISTDHECSDIIEAREKIKLGMKILIREGSAARNLESLKPLFLEKAEMLMLCSDDIHPEMLVQRHINRIAAKLIREKFDIYDVLRACSYNAIKHYGLEAGCLQTGDSADFVVVNDLQKMDILETWIRGIKVFEGNLVLFKYRSGPAINRFECSAISKSNLNVIRNGEKMRVIEVFDGELLTGSITENATAGNTVDSDISRDIIKIVVKDRYSDNLPSIGFIKGFGLRKGAFASSVAHDSHNIICVGVEDEEIEKCINSVIKMKGGLSVCASGELNSLPLKIAGIMSDNPCEEIAQKYLALSDRVKALGCPLSAPFMTLSFMALLVIPSLKISDKGLFDVDKFCFTPLFT